MNKDFFKINEKIKLLDILKILDISKDELELENHKYVSFPDKIFSPSPNSFIRYMSFGGL